MQGTLDKASGKLELEFDATFHASLWPLYSAPPLTVRTKLTSETATGQRRGTWRGERLAGGRAVLVGVAQVPRTSAAFVNALLQLPTEAYTRMSMSLTPADETGLDSGAESLESGVA